jgi:hypothetical protein
VNLYPITDNARLVSAEMIGAYLDLLFGYVDFEEEDRLALRGIGENGTPQAGGNGRKPFTETFKVDPAHARQVIHQAALRWGQHHVATYLVPAVMDGKGESEENVKLFTTLCADFDKGDTEAKLAHAERAIGPASMVVESGGVTETGQMKLHAYWRLSEPTDEISRVAELRHRLALKCGGDPSFQRWPQVIRVPGSVHAKNGIARQSKIIRATAAEFDLDEIAEAIGEMQPMPGITMPVVQLDFVRNGALDFSAAESSGSRVSEVLTTDVAAGGEGVSTRFGNFNTAAGHFIYEARSGLCTVAEARERALAWMVARMNPPWPAERFQQEWVALLNHDVKEKGSLEPPRLEIQPPVVASPAPYQILAPGENPLFTWAVDRWARGERPKRRFLVDGLVRAGQQHLFVAEGGAGKTFLVLDLAVKIATFQDGDSAEWCGKSLVDGCGGTVVIFTTEDDQEELHIRLDEIDPRGKRFKAGNKLIVVPLINAGGAFTLCERDRAGNTRPNPRWLQAVDMLSGIPDLRLVILDTFNATMHGNENDATTINEYAAAFNLIPGKLRAAGMVTHHTRKGEEPIRTAEQMAAAVRGSSAITAAFRVVIGIWPSSDFSRRLKAMGRNVQKGVLFHLAITKANNPEMMRETRTLVREKTGLLVDATTADKFHSIEDGGRAMWLMKAIEMAAAADHAYTRSGPNSPFKRKHELPPILADMTRAEFETLTDLLLERGLCVMGNLPGSSTKNAIDIATGALAAGQASRRDGAYQPPDWSAYKHDPLSGYIARGTP